MLYLEHAEIISFSAVLTTDIEFHQHLRKPRRIDAVILQIACIDLTERVVDFLSTLLYVENCVEIFRNVL